MSVLKSNKSDLTVGVLLLFATILLESLLESWFGDILLAAISCFVIGYIILAKDKTGKRILLPNQVGQAPRLVILLVMSSLFIWGVAFPNHNPFSSSPPDFEIVNPIVHPDSALLIKSGDLSPIQHPALDIQFDGIPFENGAKSITVEGQSYWSFAPDGEQRSDYLFSKGVHIVRVGIDGDYVSKEFKIFLDPSLKSSGYFELQLQEGWNLIAYPLSEPLPAERVFDSITGRSLIVRNADGDLYDPSLRVSTIGDLKPGSGLMVFVDSSTTLSFTDKGQRLNPNHMIDLQEGWNIIGYHIDNPMPIEDAFASIEDELTVVKDGRGNMYMPGNGVNSIGQLKPLMGYRVYVSEPVSFSFGS